MGRRVNFFARLARTRPGYGYVTVHDPWASEKAPDKDGIYLLNLKSGEVNLLILLEQISNFKVRPDMKGAVHWFNHLLFSPDYKRFIFLHR